MYDPISHKITLFLFILLTTFSMPAFAEPSSPLTGFHKVSNGVYRGGRPRNAAEMLWLKRSGIRTIINLQGDATTLLPGESEQAIQEASAMARKLGFQYLHLPFAAASTLDEEEEATVVKIASLLASSQAQPIYVHCNVGADRTGVAVAAFRILYQGCSSQSAVQEIYRYGHPATPLFVAPTVKFLQRLESQRAVPGAKCPL